MRIFLNSAFLLLIIILSGCNSPTVITLENDKEELQEYFLQLQLKDLDNRITISEMEPIVLNKIVNEINSNLHKSDDLKTLIDSIFNSVRRGRSSQIFYDKEFIDSAFLAKNTKLALDALALSPCKDSITMQIFTDYILPYKLGYEIADNWREELFQKQMDFINSNPQMNHTDSLFAYHMNKSYYGLKSDVKHLHHYPAEPNYSWMSFTNEGDCIHRCNNVIYHLRATGIPATFDYIPCWGNRPAARHAYVGLAHRDKQLKKLLENSNNPNNLINDLNSVINIKYIHIFDQNKMPHNWSVQYEKTLPKIYRETWKPNDETVNIYKKIPQNEIDFNLIRQKMVDVTNQYLSTVDVSVSKPLLNKSKLSYLSVFDINQWKPIAFSTFNFLGKATFNNVAFNILYLPSTVNNGNVIPVGHPFILQKDGSKKVFKPDYNNKTELILTRKYPLFANTARRGFDFLHSVIELSNDADFKDYKEAHKIDEYVLGMYKIKLNIDKPYRYLRLRSTKKRSFTIAEIECYTIENDNLSKIENILYTNNNLQDKDNKPFDGDLTTYIAKQELIYDFGTPESISEVWIAPMSDTNFIIPENEYELFYWDNGWHSSGRKIADDYQLKYNNIPSSTIYWLKCHTEGKEERIFTYENGKQIWW